MDIDKIRYFIPKVKNRIAAEKNRLWKHIDVEKASMRGYVSFKDADTQKQRLTEMFGVYTHELFKGVSNEDKETILSCAEQALRHEFDLLGSGPVHLDPIDWHIDFKSGQRWEKRYYRELTGIKGADIKVPWELSRSQHLLWLCEAYLMTGEGKYAQEVIDEITWWIDDNPLMYTVNWKCAMDVAFRAVNWLFSLNMIAGYSGYEDAFAEKVSKSLWQHGFFIKNNLEQIIPNSNNHYASDIVGLLYLGQFFGYSRKGRGLWRFAWKEYQKEVRNQVFPCGAQYELSVSYHRMMTEMLSYPVYMFKRMRVALPKDIKELISGMYDYIANYTKPNGNSPLVGDNDDGRFLPFIRRDFRKHAYLNDKESVENRIVSIGIGTLFDRGQQKSKIYEDANVAIIHQNDNYLFVNGGGFSCRPEVNQMSIGSHTHNDALSFELNIAGQDVIIDPGTYVYTSSPEERNAFRSTGKHNTVVVDEEEQNGYSKGSLFRLSRNVTIEPLTMDNKSIKGKYRTIKGGLSHQRTFEIGQNVLTITDNLSKDEGEHHGQLTYHLAEGLTPQISEGKLVMQTEKLNITLETEGLNYIIIPDTYSPSYGIKKESNTVIANFEFSKVKRLTTIIRWTAKKTTE